MELSPPSMVIDEEHGEEDDKRSLQQLFVMPPKKKEEVEELPRFGRVSNNLKMGIVGLPNVGKSSLFNLLAESGHAEVICID